MADPVVLRPAVWHSILSTEETSDKITLHNLSLTVHAGVDAWGRPRPQPALLTITITLSSPFSSAAAHDALDASTVHYGQLSKHIKSSIENGIHHLSTEELARHVGECILESAGDAQLKASEMDIFYPKGSLLGEGAGYAFSDYIDREGERAISRVGYLRNLRFNCILGVNANERLAKQAVVVNIWIECLPADLSDEYTSLELILEDVSHRGFFLVFFWFCIGS